MTGRPAAAMIAAMKTVLGLALLVTVACGSAGAPPSPSPSTAVASASTSPTPGASPTSKRLDGKAVRISVGGVEQPDGVVRPLASGPVTVTLSFPFAMDRASVERWLGAYALRWSDDRTLEVVVPEAQDSTGFKVAETASADGLSTIDFFVVSVAFPPTRILRVYAAGDLARASSDFAHPAPPLTSQRVHLGLRGTFALSPDARTILFFDFRASPGPAPFVLDVATDTARALVPAPASDGPFVYGGWLADGRLLLVGKKVWLGDARGEGMRVVADVTAPDGWPDVA